MSNKELRDQVSTLSSKLGVEVPTGLDDLKNPELLKLVADLEAKLALVGAPAAAPPSTPGDAPPDGGALPPAPPEAPVIDGNTGALAETSAPAVIATRFPYEVAPGCSISCARGILGPGEEVIPAKDVPAPVDLNRLIEIGVVLGNKVDVPDATPAG